VSALNIFVIGPTGRTGQALTTLALARGHKVTAFGRRRPQDFSDRAGFVTGNPQLAADLAPAISGHDAVVSCLGQRTSSDAGLLSRSASAAASALGDTNVRRYVVVSQGLLFSSANPVVLLLRLILRRHVADSRAMEEVVTKTNLDWTIVRPPRLTSGKPSGGFKKAAGAQPKGSWSMDYDDLGACLLDMVESRSNVREIVGVTSA
jgi:putative NADH-flavin reductase